MVPPASGTVGLPFVSLYRNKWRSEKSSNLPQVTQFDGPTAEMQGVGAEELRLGPQSQETSVVCVGGMLGYPYISYLLGSPIRA